MEGATRTAFAGMWRHSLRWRLRWGVAFLFSFFVVVSGAHAGKPPQGTEGCANFFLPRDVTEFYDHIGESFKSMDPRDRENVWASFCKEEDKVDKEDKEDKEEKEERDYKDDSISIRQMLINILKEKQKEPKHDVPKTIVIEQTKPKDCSDLLANGESKSGVHTIHPYNGHSARVFCDMESDGGGWTVFLARMNQSEQLNFTRNWDDYKNGFGLPESEYWLGNENLHRLTSARNYSVRIDAEDDEEKNWVEWETFKVESESEKYRLTLGDQKENTTVHGQLLSDNDGFKFSTFDQVNDIYADICGERGDTGGWWYDLCSSVQTLSIDEPPGDDILTYWTPFNYSVPFGRTSLHLKIRPVK